MVSAVQNIKQQQQIPRMFSQAWKVSSKHAQGQTEVINPVIAVNQLVQSAQLNGISGNSLLPEIDDILTSSVESQQLAELSSVTTPLVDIEA